MPRLFPAAIFLALLACLVAGCGASDSTGSSGGPLSKAAFLEQGNDICAQAAKQRDQDLKAATEDSDGSGGSEEMAHLVDVALESVEEMADELSDLEPPPAQQKATKALVKELEREVEARKAAPDEPVTLSSFEAANATARNAQLYDCQI